MDRPRRRSAVTANLQLVREHGPATGKAAESFLARAFDGAGWLGWRIDDSRVAVRCPWADEHTDKRGRGRDSSTIILSPNNERPLGQFVCLHEHCRTRGVVQALRALPLKAIADLAEQDPQGFSLARSLITSVYARAAE
jgi:hypothetical protein